MNMKLKFLLSLFLCCLVLPLTAGTDISGNITVGGQSRNYIGYLPDNLGQNRPLLIFCHGYNQDAGWIRNSEFRDTNNPERNINIEAVCDTAKFVVVFPNGIDKAWDISGDRDINFVKAIIDKMATDHKIDRKRVYLGGFSMGGMFTYHAMNRIPDLIAAFCPVSGYPMGGATANANVRSIPILHIHGTSDETVAFSGVQPALNVWINHNGCPASAKVVNNYNGFGGAKMHTWGPGNGGVEVKLLELPNKGHWVCKEPQVYTGKEIWNFCKRYSTDGPVTDGLPALHVEGKWLVNEFGNQLTLHGVMDTPSAWFNNGRWGWSYDDAGRLRCLDYFEKIFAGLEKANCDVFRLHLEPAWTNDPSSSYTYPKAAKQPAEATQEADISKFNPERLRTYLTSLYIPLMQKAMAHGLYVVVRPPGVCPPNLKVKDYYQEYLLEVWDIVSKDATIQKYAGQISLELANEPVNLRNADNQDDARALQDYFQPIVDEIRSNGFTGIIWVPGTGWQSNYRSYAQYPIKGSNIGYAVHDYTGWYGCSDDNPDPQNKINQFHNQVPVVDNYPIIITEVDWSPKKPGTGHYNERNEWVESNYGTWSTGSTSKWGKAYRAMLDHFQNISMTLSGTSCLIDVDQLINNGVVTAAFDGNPEACGQACMEWYAEWKGVQLIEGFGEEITSMDYIASGNRFMIGSGSNVLNFETTQNAISQSVTALPLSSYYYYTLTKIGGYDDVYAVNIVDRDGTPFPAPYNLGSNLNVSMYGGIIFSGSAQADGGKGYGTDFANGGLWKVEYVEGEGFTFRNMYSDTYMNMAGTQDGVAYMHLYKGVKMLGDDPADDQIFALSKATGFDAETGVLTGGWTFDDPVDISRWDYLVITTTQTAADASRRIVIADANGKTVSGEDYDGAGTGGKMWLDRWNNQNAIRISIGFLSKNLGLDVRNIKELTIRNGWSDSYQPISIGTVCLTDYANTKINGSYAGGDFVRSYGAPGSFGTVCLPYRAVCAGAEVYYVTGLTSAGIAIERVDGLMEAGVPYIYKATDAIGQNNEAAVCNVNFFRADKPDYDVAAPGESNGLVGTFTDMTVPQGDNFYVLKNNKLYYTTDATVSLSANRAYVDKSAVQDVAAGRVVIGFDEATGIKTVRTMAGDAVYDLQGRRLATQPRKGIYIVNSKKVIR